MNLKNVFNKAKSPFGGMSYDTKEKLYNFASGAAFGVAAIAGGALTGALGLGAAAGSLTASLLASIGGYKLGQKMGFGQKLLPFVLGAATTWFGMVGVNKAMADDQTPNTPRVVDVQHDAPKAPAIKGLRM
ncbi:MAG: hypothetical protein OXT65_07850 [Alphaproteobacteria bacterium]|nr:hypothetical protein [Alphaproteobacteria bacterium]